MIAPVTVRFIQNIHICIYTNTKIETANIFEMTCIDCSWWVWALPFTFEHLSIYWIYIEVFAFIFYRYDWPKFVYYFTQIKHLTLVKIKQSFECNWWSIDKCLTIAGVANQSTAIVWNRSKTFVCSFFTRGRPVEQWLGMRPTEFTLK